MRLFEFQSPWFLLLLVPLAVWAWRRSRRPWRPASIQFSDVGLFATTPPGAARTGRQVLAALRFLALGLLVVALARPRFGTVERDVIREGVDLFYCLDVSGSMQAEDFAPTRLEKAKELTAQLATRRTRDRQGIVLFAGTSFMLCPLTFDAETVQQFLQSVAFDELGVDGTAIGMGISRALKKLQDSQAKSRVIVLMTDGENNAGEINPLQAAQVAKSMGVKIYAIGIGSRGRATITQNTPYGPRRMRIETNIDEELLEHIATETGGMYRRATRAEELESILAEIDQLETSRIETKEYRSYDERMATVAWPALFLLLLEVALANTRFMKIP
ncbi:VWA domain-containing protein [Candidatus Sumerlaeota bacterium]|nr:VWA domain-containing protein [Candidatus Sumerlaeota bacterium]